MIKKTLIFLISIYQVTLSPDHGFVRAWWPQGVCRFRPTCSDFTKQQLQQHGVRGLLVGLRQLMHCHF